jgi:hypothetical protein
MPTTRTPIARQWRPGRFDREALELFTRLERASKRERETHEWRQGSLLLNRLVDLSARSSGALGLWANLLDIGPAPPDQPGTFYREDWEICRDMRTELLEACAEAGLLYAGTGRRSVI